MAMEEKSDSRRSDKSPSSSQAATTTTEFKQIPEVCIEVLRRLSESNNQDSTQPYTEQQLCDHINRFICPDDYANSMLKTADDVVVNMRLLDLAKDPNKRPAIHLRQLPLNHPMPDPSSSFSTTTQGHRITASTGDILKLESQMYSIIRNLGLKMIVSHAFVVDDYGDYSIGAFVVYGWPYEETEQLRVALEKEAIKIKADDWEILPEYLNLGKHVASLSYGDLYKGTFCTQEVAIKVFRSTLIDFSINYELDKEFSILRKVRHKNVVRFVGACITPPCLSIVTEYMPDGTVYDYLHKKEGAFKRKALLRVALDVANGMNYLHLNNKIHMNLKAANLMMDENGVVKVPYFVDIRRILSGFGILSSETETHRWMAPEVIEDGEYSYNFKAIDYSKAYVYNFGILLWELLTTKLPYENLTASEAIVRAVLKGKRPPIPRNTHPKLVKLIKKCWHQDPIQRPEFSEIIEILQNIAEEVDVEGRRRGFLYFLRRASDLVTCRFWRCKRNIGKLSHGSCHPSS